MTCGEPVERSHRFCPWCAAPLRSKLVEFFAPHPQIEGEAYGLRVSRYLGGEPSTQHTRFSIWGRDSALAAISLDTAETQRLVRYLGERGRDPDDSPTEQMPAVSG
jgi:hypothetical protein